MTPDEIRLKAKGYKILDTIIAIYTVLIFISLFSKHDYWQLFALLAVICLVASMICKGIEALWRLSFMENKMIVPVTIANDLLT